MAGGVEDGQNVSAGVTNPAFLIKNADDDDPSRLGLGSTQTNAGPVVTASSGGIQRVLNALSSFLGVATSAAYNVLPTWVTNNWGTSTDTVFARVEALDTAFDDSTGHNHDGSPGSGGPLTIPPGTTIQADVNPALSGTVSLISGTNVTLVQSGQDITISSTGGGGGGGSLSYWSGYHHLSMNWNTTSLSFADFTSTGATPAVTQRNANGIVVTQAAGNLPGITFTPSSVAAVYLITATGGTNSTASLSLQLTDGSVVIDTAASTNSTGNDGPQTLIGTYTPNTTSPVTVKIQGTVNTGTGNLQSVAAEESIEWTVVELTSLGAPVSPGGIFQSSQVTTQAGVTATSFTTFSNSPALTVTPSISGAYKVYCSIPQQFNMAIGDAVYGISRIFNTSGGATLLAESQGLLGQDAGTANGIATTFIQSVYNLTAGVTYVFDIQGVVPSGLGGSELFVSPGPSAFFYMFAELASNGGSSVPVFSGASVYRNAGQSIVSSSQVTIAFDTAISDPATLFNLSTGVATVNKTGMWSVTLGCSFVPGSTWTVGNVCQSNLLVNGSTQVNAFSLFQAFATTPGGYGVWNGGTVTILLNSGDTIESQLFQNTGATGSVENNQQRCYMMIKYEGS